MPKKYTRWSRRIERNLLATYHRANNDDRTEGLLWYSQAHQTACDMARKYRISLEQSAGCIAALSPGRNWGMNIMDADIFISEWVNGARGSKLPSVGTYGRKNPKKCEQILSGEIPLDVLGGKKVRAFYANVLDPTSGLTVTIDRHAKCAAFGARGKDNSLVKDSEYDYLAWHFRKLAERIGLVPNQFQAVCWVTWRRLKGELAQMDLVEEVPF